MGEIGNYGTGNSDEKLRRRVQKCTLTWIHFDISFYPDLLETFFQIVETVSNSSMDNVDKSEIDSFYASVPLKDLELVVGPVIDRARSRSNSPLPDASSQNSYAGKGIIFNLIK